MALRLAHCGFVGLLALSLQTVVLGEVVPVTQSVSVRLSPLGKVTMLGSVELVHGMSAFSEFTATLPVSFRARTTPSGLGTITVQANSEFTPVGGPSISAGMLTYTCLAAAYGSACTGAQTISTTTQRPVVTLPANACTGGGSGCSSADPATVNLLLRLENDASMSTGSFSVQLTFTVSCT